MAIPLAFIPVISQTITELFKFGGSLRKEAISVAIAPAVVGVYSAMSTACVESCSFSQAMFAPSGLQWSALITGVVALVVHLRAKAKVTEQAE